LSFPKFLIGNPKVFTEEEGKIHRGFPLPLYRFLIEPFRNDPPPSFPKSLIGNPNAFKTMDPGLKIAGVTNKG